MAKKYSDTELLDFLQKLNDEENFTGKCVLRMSTTRRGWRLHETSLPGAKKSVREAISNFMELRKRMEN
jgi:hypothetical protein